MLRRIGAVGLSVLMSLGAMVSWGPQPALAYSILNTTEVDVSPTGQPANYYSGPSTLFMTPDARYVTFVSQATNLTADVLPPGNPQLGRNNQVFLYDRHSHSMELESRTSTGEVGNLSSTVQGVSNDGRYVLFYSIATNLGGPAGSLYIRDRQTGTLTYLGYGDAGHLSGDGLVVLFRAGGGGSYYVYDQRTGESTQLPSTAATNIITTLSADGRYVGYIVNGTSGAARYDLQTGVETPIGNVSFLYKFTSDGNYALVNPGSSDPDYNKKLFLVNVATGERQMVFDVASVNSNPGTQLWLFGDLTGDGRMLAVNVWTHENGQSIKRLWVVNIATGDKVVVTGTTSTGSLSSDGSQIAFSDQNTLGDGFTHVFVDQLGADTAPPVLETPSWTVNPKAVNEETMVTVPATDNMGVTAGEYYVGDTDPGVGNGTVMSWDGTNLSASFDNTLQPGVYAVHMRARDAAGNWSAVTTDYLVVYDPATTLGVTGKNKKDLVPSLASGDVMPGLVASGQTDAADYGLTVDYAGGVLDPKNDFQFSYATGSHCGRADAANCHSLTLNATGFDWLILDQANNSRARFAGTASVTVDGVTTTNPFTVEAIDGDRLSPTGNDHLALKVYAPGANSVTATPMWQASGNVAKSNGVRVR